MPLPHRNTTLALAFAGALATGTPAQVPPGRFLATQPANTAGSVLSLFEPLRAGFTPIADPLGLVSGARAAVVGPTPSRLWVAVNDSVLTVDLQGTSIVAARSSTGPLGAPVVDLALLPDGRGIAVTAREIVAIPAGGGAHLTLGIAAATDTFVGVVSSPHGPAALAQRSPRGGAIYLLDPVAGRFAAHAIAVDGPTALAFDPVRDSFAVGDRLGSVSLVEANRLVTSHLVSSGASPVRSIGYDSDQGTLWIGASGSLWLLAGNVLRGPFPVPGRAEVDDLDHHPYDSTFSTYGASCAGSTTTPPTLSATGQPHPGSGDFTVLLRNAAPQAGASLLLGIAPVSIALAPFGMNGCTLLVDVLDSRPATTSALGRATLGLPIPAQPNLVGFSLHLQWLCISPGANRLSLLTTNGGRATF